MAKVIGPWTPNYPVDFKSNGDTTRAAFGKHIQEIERIYGLLSGLGAAKIEAEDLTAAMTANKNEWTTAIAAEKSARESAIAAEKSARESAIAAEVTARSNGDVALGRRIDGLTFGNIGGTLGMDRTTGNLDASRINGLGDVIRQNTVAEGEVSANGYAKFGNGLMIQWGKWTFEVDHSKEYIKTRNFPRPFPTQCFQVVLTTNVRLYEELENKDYSGVDAGVLTLTWNKNSCRTIFNAFSIEMNDIKEVYASFLAIGN